jgi:hypothetical protein
MKSAVRPLGEVAPATMTAIAEMHAGHIGLSFSFIRDDERICSFRTIVSVRIWLPGDLRLKATNAQLWSTLLGHLYTRRGFVVNLISARLQNALLLIDIEEREGSTSP